MFLPRDNQNKLVDECGFEQNTTNAMNGCQRFLSDKMKMEYTEEYIIQLFQSHHNRTLEICKLMPTTNASTIPI
jgi:hypothetical protein